MELETYVRQVQDQLTAAAALGDDRVREVAATLATAAAPAVRLAVLSAMAAGADEITAALLDSPGAPSVAVRLEADEIHVAVSAGAAEPIAAPRADEGDASARISLRLSEALKAEIDAAATGAGVSVNTWLIRAATTALGAPDQHPHHPHGPHGAAMNPHNAHRVTGWING